MPLDDADKKYIADLLAESLKRQTDETIKIVDERVKPLGARLEGVEKKATEKPEDKAEDKPGDKKAGDKSDPELERMRAKLAELEAKNKAAEEERKAAEEKARQDRLHGAARDALLAAGVPADRARIALAAIKDEGLLAYNDAGEPGFKFARKGYSEVVDAKAGAEEWLKSDAGKLFLPPSDVRGTGQRSGKAPPTGGGSQPVGADTLARDLFNRALGG